MNCRSSTQTGLIRLFHVGLLLTVVCPATSKSQTQGTASNEINFAGVSDNTPVEHGDTLAYYSLLNQVRGEDDAALNRRAQVFITQQWQRSKYHALPESQYPLFHEMLMQPASFRGQPVLLRGHVLRVDSYEAGPNPFGIETLYECWLVTDDAQNHPLTVVFLEKPPGLSVGEELVDGVEVAGYFLKVYTYPSLDRVVRRAPLILAQTIRLSQPIEVSAGKARFLGLVILCGFAMLLVIVRLVTWRDQRLMQQLRRKTTSASAPDFSRLP